MTDSTTDDATPRKVKVGFYQDPREAGEARAAYLATHELEGHRSFSDFIAAAVRREVERLRDLHHQGLRWDEAGAGNIPAGRPRALTRSGTVPTADLEHPR